MHPADRRRRSGLTIEQRVAELSNRILALAKHYPLDGIHLIQVFEELCDSTEYKLERSS